MIIPNIWKHKKCSKPPPRSHNLMDQNLRNRSQCMPVVNGAQAHKSYFLDSILQYPKLEPKKCVSFCGMFTLIQFPSFSKWMGWFEQYGNIFADSNPIPWSCESVALRLPLKYEFCLVGWDSVVEISSIHQNLVQRHSEEICLKAQSTTMSHHVTTCHTMSRYVTPCHTMSHHVTLCHTMSQHVTPCHTMTSIASGMRIKFSSGWHRTPEYYNIGISV